MRRSGCRGCRGLGRSGAACPRWCSERSAAEQEGGGARVEGVGHGVEIRIQGGSRSPDKARAGGLVMRAQR
jgi:hypothetical protein